MHHHCLPLEELVRHSRVLLQEEGGEEEEAQEGEADDLRPASQPGSASQWSDETRRLATATGRDPELVFTSISLDRDNSGDWNLGLTSLVLAASCWQCCTSGLNTVRNAAVSGASSETSSCSRSGGNMSSVRIRYSADWKAGMWPGATPTATTVPLPAVD